LKIRNVIRDFEKNYDFSLIRNNKLRILHNKARNVINVFGYSGQPNAKDHRLIKAKIIKSEVEEEMTKRKMIFDSFKGV